MCTRRLPAPTPRAWSTPTTSSGDTRSTGTPKCPPMPPAMAACVFRSRMPRPCLPGCRSAIRWMTTPRMVAGAVPSELTRVPELQPAWEQTGQEAEPEAVDEQDEQGIDDLDRPLAAGAGCQTREGRGERGEGFVQGFVQAALVPRLGRIAVRR